MPVITFGRSIGIVGLAALVGFAYCQARPGKPTFHAPGKRAPGRPAGGLNPILARLIAAANTVTMEGIRDVTFVQEKKPNRREHVYYDRGNVRIEQVGGAGEIMIEGPKGRFNYLPQRHEIYQGQGRGLGAQIAFLGGIGGKLMVDESPGGAVAGFGTRLIQIKNAQGKLLQRIWAENNSSAILKREGYDAKGNVRLAYAFSEVLLGGSMPASLFEPNFPGAKLITPEDELKRIAKNLKLPPFMLDPSTGFTLYGAGKLKAGDTNILKEFYGNGKLRLSLFVLAKSVNDQAISGLTGKNLSSFVFQKDGCSIVLVGNIDPNTLRQLAESVRTEQRD